MSTADRQSRSSGTPHRGASAGDSLDPYALHRIVAFTEELQQCPDDQVFYRRAVEFAREHLGLERCAIWVREGGVMRGTFGTDLTRATTVEYNHRQPMDEMWTRIFDAAVANPRWQLHKDALLYEWDGRKPRPLRRGWLAATPILKHSSRVAVLTNDTAISNSPVLPDRQGLVEFYCALLGHLIARREVQVALARRSEYYSTLLQHVLDIIVVFDPQGHIINVNAAVTDTLGYRPEELAGRQAMELVHPEDRERAWSELQRTAAAQEPDPHPIPVRVLHRDGTTRNLESIGNRVVQGDEILLVATLRDITERQRADRVRHAGQRVSDAALNTASLQAFLAALHRIVGDMAPARNCFVALYDPASNLLSFPYWVDERDPPANAKTPGRGLVEYALRRGETLLLARRDWEALVERGEVDLLGAPPESWLAVPLRVGDEVRAVLVLQSYGNAPVLTEQHRDELHALAQTAAVALAGKLHQEALAATEQNFRTLFAAMPDAFLAVDLVYDDAGRPVDAVVRQANPAIESILGDAPEKLTGRRLSEVLPGHPRPWFAICAQAAADRMPARFEFFSERIRRHLAFTAFGSGPGRLALIIEDVTAARTAEQELRRRDAILQATAFAAERFLGAPDWISCAREVLKALGKAAEVSRIYVFENHTRPDGRFLASQRFEWVAEGVRPLQGDPLTTQCDLEALGLARWLQLLPAGQMIDGPTHQLPAIEQPWLRAQDIQSVLALPILVQGRWWGFMGFVECGHARTWAPAEKDALRSAAQILAEAIQRKLAEEQSLVLHAALASAANGIVITDREGRIVFVNDALTRLTGYSAREVIGQKPSLLRSGHHEPDFYRDLWQTVLAGRVWRGELTNRRKDGSLYLEEMTITPVRDAAGKLTHFIAIKQDISERRNLQQQLLQAQKMESVGRLAGGIAHDFNNLLQAITGFSSILLAELGAGDPRRSDVEEIERAAQRAVTLTRQLLAFSRKQKMELAPVNLNLVLTGTEKMLRRLIGEDVALVTALAEPLPPVRADAGQIEQIVVNLAVNARDAMPGGGQLHIGTTTVVLSAEDLPATPDARPGPFVRLDVRDTGSGMTPQVRERIFEPFFSTKGPGRGTGLGLAVVYGIIRQHEGFIAVDTEPGRGTCFSIYLPVTAEAAEPAPPQAPREVAGLEGRGERLLVVEDEEGVRDLAVRVLSNHRYALTVAGSVEEALRLHREATEPFDLLFTDIVLPDGNGINLADELRRRQPGLSVLLTSAYSDDDARWPAIQRRGYRFIAKPYPVAAVLRALRQTLEAAPPP